MAFVCCSWSRRLVGIVLLLLLLALPTMPALAQSASTTFGRHVGYTGTGYTGFNYPTAAGAVYPYAYGNSGYLTLPYGYLDPNFGPYVYSSFGFPYFGVGIPPYGYYDPLFAPYAYGGYGGTLFPGLNIGVFGP